MLQHQLIRLWPIALSAIFLLVSSLIIQAAGQWYSPTFSLLASRGLGKIIFTLLVIGHLGILVRLQSAAFRQQWLKTNVYFLGTFDWITSFLNTFTLFFMLHAGTLVAFVIGGFANYQSSWYCSYSVIASILFGFIVTFFLAWTEELIFRGTIYPFLAQFFSPLGAIFLASIIFMGAHDITQPWNLVTAEWKLGLGLFLLGLLLNLIFVITEKLYVGMGIHAGLVFVKVILRRIKLLHFLPAPEIPYWIHQDLRQSLVVHGAFLVVIIMLIMCYQKKLTKSISNKNV